MPRPPPRPGEGATPMATKAPKAFQAPKPVDASQIRKIAREQFGFENLRFGQEEAIRLVLAGHDTLSVMPTGSGKSAVYQICGLLIDGPTVVVSPLIALQKDQVGSIQSRDLGDGAEAALLNSTQRV